MCEGGPPAGGPTAVPVVAGEMQQAELSKGSAVAANKRRETCFLLLGSDHLLNSHYTMKKSEHLLIDITILCVFVCW